MYGLPRENFDHKLTGKTRFRVGREVCEWEGWLRRRPVYRDVVVLQVQETYKSRFCARVSEDPVRESIDHIHWRDMRVTDFMEMPT